MLWNGQHKTYMLQIGRVNNWEPGITKRVFGSVSN
jgi:hypothetical protein